MSLPRPLSLPWADHWALDAPKFRVLSDEEAAAAFSEQGASGAGMLQSVHPSKGAISSTALAALVQKGLRLAEVGGWGVAGAGW